jgi:hypothetical protein
LGNIKPPSTPSAASIKPVPPAEEPPKIRIQSAEKKVGTARIDLSSVQPAPGGIQNVKPEDVADAFKRSTIRIESTVPEETPPDVAKKSTLRVDAPRKPMDTQKVKGETHEIAPDVARKTSLRVEPPKHSDTQAAKAETHRIQEASKKATMRVDSVVEQKKKSETARLEISPAELTKRSTSKITIEGEAVTRESEDVFKRRTMPVSVPTTPPPAAAKPPIAGARPKTVVLRPAGGPPAAQGEPISPAPPAAVSEARKSETARLDLPPETEEERPATRPKTIRIKRPDGTTGRKALTIARPSEEAIFTAEAAAEVKGGEFVGAEESVGAVWSVAALAAVLVAAVLVYVLAAQTVAPNLPWPGRIL